MRRLSLFCVVFVGLTFLTTGVWADEDDDSFDWENELQRDLVTVEDGKMTYSELQLCEVEGTSRAFQTRWKAEAPEEGLISRDQFVATVTQLEQTMVIELLDKADISVSDYFDRVDCEPTDNAIGEVDLSVTITFAERGMQRVIETGETTKRRTMTWDSLF